MWQSIAAIFKLVWTEYLFSQFLLCLQISLNGLEILCLMIDRMGEEFKPYVTTGTSEFFT